MNFSVSRCLRPLCTPVRVAILALLSGGAAAEDLLQIYDLAVNNDPAIREARANYNATHTLLDQGRSQLLPTVNLTARTSRDSTGIAGEPPPPPPGSRPLQPHSFQNGFNTKGYGLSVQQNLLNFQAWYLFQSVRTADEIAAVNLAQSEQELIMRVSTAYFNVLRSETNLALFRAELEASNQVLDQTQQRFDVGLIPITDVYDSRANADLAEVNLLIEENNLNDALEALEAITGISYMNVAELSSEFPITTSDTSMAEWTAVTLENNLALLAAQFQLEVREDEARAARAALFPTVALNLSYNWNESGNPFSFTPNLPSENTGITLNFSMPIFAGGLNRARMRQAYYVRDASEEALLLTRRTSTQSIRNAYRNVETDVRAVNARAQAIISAESALEATQVGAEVGTRNVVDVVLAQRTLFQAQRDYAAARFDYVIDTLNLKQAAGVLSPQDVIDLNAWLVE